MKECYFCSSTIPEDATVCPMCGLDLSEVDTPPVEPEKEEPVVTTYVPNQEAKSRKAENGLHFKKIGVTFLNYFTYYFKKVTHPVQIGERSERHPFYGYVNVLLASLFSAGIITRVADALDRSYQFMLDISILPSLTFELNGFEWFWKWTLFFLVYFLLYSILSYLFKKYSTKQPLNFHNWVTQFTSMNTFYFLLLCVFFILAMIVPLGLAAIVLLIVFLHSLSYLIAFITTLYSEDREGKENKTFYQGLIGISIHCIVMVIFAYFLLKL